MSQAGQSPTPVSSSSTSATPGQSTQPSGTTHQGGWRDSSLPVVIFLATLLGSLIGVAADLSEASGLVTPLVELVNPSPELRIVGSNTVLSEGIAAANDWQEEFVKQTTATVAVPLVGPVQQHANITIQAIGSVAGAAEATQGLVDLLVFSEPMPQEQYQTLTQAGIEVECAAEIGYDVIAFITDINNVVPAISTRDMAGILSGDITNWSAVGGSAKPIHILVRPGSGTTDIVLQRFTGSSEFRPEFISCESNSDCLNLALSTPGSLYWVSTAWLQTQPPRYLRLILVRRGNLPPANPLEENFNPDNYALELIRPLYMYVLSGPNISPSSTALARDFLNHVRGVRGQEIMESHNFYTYFDPPAEVQLETLPGFGSDATGLPVVCR